MDTDDYYDESPDESGDWEEYDYTHDDDGLVAAPILSRQDSYVILKPDDLEAKQRKVVDDVSELLGVNQWEAGVLLRHFRWNKNALQEAWFDSETKVRQQAGLRRDSVSHSSETSNAVICQICYDSHPLPETFALGCGHRFCHDCWTGFVGNAVESGANCIFTSCPMQKCNEIVPEEIMLRFAPAESKAKYKRFMLRSYVDDNKSVKWCPSAGCENAVEYPSRGLREIRCTCGFIFCFVCSQEGHRPCECELVQRWSVKNSAESENVTWIMANTKACPQCRKPIEKNQGCNHMTCTKNAGGCGFEFCWLCQGPWSDHSTSTGGYYKCNKYEKAAKEGKTKDDDSKRTKAKTELDRYMFYFERFVNHDKARKIAQKQVPLIENKMQLLHDLKGYPVSELQFLLDALNQVVECRRVLRWTYPFGYYLSQGPEKNLFEHLQQQLEENTEHLHELLEKPLEPFLDSHDTSKIPFYSYKSELTNYTNVTKKFLNNLLEGIDAGLTSVS